MRFILTFALIICMSGMLAACNDGQSGQRIGVVDLNRLMRDSAPGKAGLKFIEEQQSQLQARLDDIQDRLEKNPKDEKAAQELQRVYATSQQQIQAEGQNVVGMLFDSIQKALNSYRNKNGYAMLIRAEALDSYDPSLDVTNAVMEEVNKLQLEFRPLAAEAPAAAEPSAGENARDEAKK